MIATLSEPIRWENVNFYEEVQKLMYPDGFHKAYNHGLWKLKTKLSVDEWNAVRDYFQYYKEGDEVLQNVRYYGWATTNPVGVMKIIYRMRKLN